MVKATQPPANGFVAGMRRLYKPLGFSKGYNFVLWFITIGYLMGFTLARFQYLSFYGIFCNPSVHGASGAAPGECYYYLQDPFRIGMMLHLFCILPAAFLVCFQFVPTIRHKVILFHRINGYLVILLSTIASAGVLIVAQHAFGGDMATRTMVGALVISTTLAYIFAWINIKRLQIDQHRAWMMRAWAYTIMYSAAAIISLIGGFYTTRSCVQIASTVGKDMALNLYPGCLPFFQGENDALEVLVKGNSYSSNNPMAIAAATGITFGSAGWLAFWIHAIAIEFYLSLTPAESRRLRQVSYERQLERGFKHPGSAVLVAQRLGDADPYVPLLQRQQASSADEMGMLHR
ncbi:hypothetical protein LTR17_027230 [Elasticomyces elasticus]|nr:hypothetical protein LTR17_027230 [Elasticomyces elasticus]